MKFAPLILVLALLGMASPALAEPAVATGAVNVRTGPGTSYRVIDTLGQGERVETQRCVSGWCLISYAGPGGWVSRNYLAELSERPRRPRFEDRPVYDSFGGHFDREFCDRFWPRLPPRCEPFFQRRWPYRPAGPPGSYPPPHWPGQGPGYTDPWPGSIIGPYRFNRPD